jgi:parallel beta-helix repeat protein
MNFKIIVPILLVIFTINCASAATITVDANSHDDPDNFSSIQAAINFAQKNDSIVICKGNYSENLIIDKQLRLYSKPSDSKEVIITPNTTFRSIIRITSNNVEISGLTILGLNKENQEIGVFLDNVTYSLIQNNIISNVEDGLFLNASSGNRIENNVFLSNTFHGINLVNSANNDLENNRIVENKRGLYLNKSDQNTLINNNASGNKNYGIALRKSGTNNITSNQMKANKYGLCLIDSDKNTIFDNFAGSNKQHGFLLWTSESNDIIDNILIENKYSGAYIRSSCSNNTLDGNVLSNNSNGISIGNSINNFIINNTISSNKEYGIFYLFSYKDNVVKGNLFLDNIKGENNLKPSSTLIYTILLLITATGLAYYLRKKSLLKKTLTGLSILIVLSFITIVAYYFPFESTNPENNVEITNFSWYNYSEINQTHTQGTLSIDINYRNKQAYTNNFAETLQTDVIPAKIKIYSKEYAADGFTEGLPMLIHEKDINLTYGKQFEYKVNLELENNTKQKIQTTFVFKEEYDYPHPYYGESKWEIIGQGMTIINL